MYYLACVSSSVFALVLEKVLIAFAVSIKITVIIFKMMIMVLEALLGMVIVVALAAVALLAETAPGLNCSLKTPNILC